MTTGRGSSELAPQAWAVTERDARALTPFALERGLRLLRPTGIVIRASTAGRGGPLGVFRRSDWPLRLSEFRVDRTWEGRPTPRHQRRLRWAAIRGWRLDVRVYFGTQQPSAQLLATAQGELARLRLPGR